MTTSVKPLSRGYEQSLPALGESLRVNGLTAWPNRNRKWKGGDWENDSMLMVSSYEGSVGCKGTVCVLPGCWHSLGPNGWVRGNLFVRVPTKRQSGLTHVRMEDEAHTSTEKG